MLIGEEGCQTLNSKYVTVVGVGGVGGYAAMLLVRAGVGKIRIVDFDIVDKSNINRQLVANSNTVGKKKVKVLGQMLKEINPALIVEEVDERLTENNAESLIPNCDIVIDAIDSVKDKVALIVHCKKRGLPIISAMGAGNRIDLPRFYLTDIYKTHDDGLAKVMRKRLREAGVDDLEVVTTDAKPLPCEGVGSISYYPAMCGITISAIVINKFLGGKNETN